MENELPDLNPSYPPESRALEWIGDGVLHVVIRAFLVKHCPHLSIGQKHDVCEALACNVTLSRLAVENGLAFDKNHKLCGRVIEQILGFIYQRQGIKAAEKFAIALFKDEVVRVLQIKSLTVPKTLKGKSKI